MIIRRFLNKFMVHSSWFIVKSLKLLGLSFSFAFCALSFTFICYAQENKTEEPIVVNGDVVEYSAGSKEFTATGNAEVIYKGMKLTCHKLKVNSETKDAEAEGNARLDEEKGVIEGSKLIYNFNTRKGIIIDSNFRSNPYFGRANKVDKASDDEFIALRGYYTTCNYDLPHYRIKSRKMNFFPGDKIQTKDDLFYIRRSPVFYLPQYNHSLKDPLVHTQLMSGTSKEWGIFTLSAWRYNLTDNLSGRIYFDYRAKKGVAEGLGANYKAKDFGGGDFKYYYTQERDHRLTKENRNPRIFQRYFIRWRHQWAIDDRTNLTSEYFKIVDSKRIVHGTDYNILKDYFPREYEKDSLPLSYVTLRHFFDYSSLDILMQKRTNRWYTQQEKLPEMKYAMPSNQIGSSPFYFEHSSSYLNSNSKSAVPSESWNDSSSNAASVSNGVSLPTKMAFINLTPAFSVGQSYSDKSTYGSTLAVSFSPGLSASTQFYRLFNAKTNFLGLNIDGLRHIITPSASYSYSNTSTMPGGKSRFGGRASIASSSVPVEISNKLQTRRKGQKVDLANLKINSTYTIKPKTLAKRGSSFSDLLFDLELLPYSWLRVDADATYKHTDKYAEGYNRFSTVNYDFNFNFGEERTFGFGQRYQRKGGKQITNSLNWRLNPKWRFALYQSRNIGRVPGINRGLREQEYVVSRDLHCWTMDFTYNVKRGEGETIWLIFRLKAFPELEFEYNQMYHAPKPGTQSNP